MLMRKTIAGSLLLPLLFFIACSKTAGNAGLSETAGKADLPKQSADPFLFTFTGTKAQLLITLKRFMTIGGFEVAKDDPAAGILASELRALSDDEKSGPDAAQVQDAGAARPCGRIIFSYKTKSVSSVNIRMICRASRCGKDGAKDENAAEDFLPKSHPFPVKMRQTLRIFNLDPKN